MTEPRVAPLDEGANIYMAIDSQGRCIGTGTKEVCEFLAKLSVMTIAKPNVKTPGTRDRADAKLLSTIGT
jgi:hypothetical protein